MKNMYDFFLQIKFQRTLACKENKRFKKYIDYIFCSINEIVLIDFSIFNERWF